MAFKMKYSEGSFPFKMTFEDRYGDQIKQKQSYYQDQKAQKQDEWNRAKESGRMDHAITLGDSTTDQTVKGLKKDKRKYQWQKVKSFFGGGKQNRENIQQNIDWTKQHIDKYKSGY